MSLLKVILRYMDFSFCFLVNIDSGAVYDKFKLDSPILDLKRPIVQIVDLQRAFSIICNQEYQNISFCTLEKILNSEDSIISALPITYLNLQIVGHDISHLNSLNTVDNVDSDSFNTAQLLSTNPKFRKILERNPQVRHALNDPASLFEIIKMSSNKKYYSEVMRGYDRQLSNQ